MKFCPNCGASINGNEKFCPHCGHPLNGKSSAIPKSKPTGPKSSQQRPGTRTNYSQNWQQANQTMGEAKNYFTRYFDWLVKTWKDSVSNNSHVHPYFGITSFVISAILMILSMNNLLNSIMSLISSLLNSFGGLGDGFIGDAVKAKNFSLGSTVIMCLLGFVIYVAVGFVARNITIARQTNVLRYSNQLAAHTNSALLLSAVTFILTLLSLYGLAFMAFILATVVYNVGLIYSIVEDSKKANQIYVAVAASCCVPLLIMIVTSFMASIELG